MLEGFFFLIFVYDIQTENFQCEIEADSLLVANA